MLTILEEGKGWARGGRRLHSGVYMRKRVSNLRKTAFSEQQMPRCASLHVVWNKIAQEPGVYPAVGIRYCQPALQPGLYGKSDLLDVRKTWVRIFPAAWGCLGPYILVVS
jgi:hypothetical protein